MRLTLDELHEAEAWARDVRASAPPPLLGGWHQPYLERHGANIPLPPALHQEHPPMSSTEPRTTGYQVPGSRPGYARSFPGRSRARSIAGGVLVRGRMGQPCPPSMASTARNSLRDRSVLHHSNSTRPIRPSMRRTERTAVMIASSRSKW